MLEGGVEGPSELSRPAYVGRKGAEIPFTCPAWDWGQLLAGTSPGVDIPEIRAGSWVAARVRRQIRNPHIIC